MRKGNGIICYINIIRQSIMAHRESSDCEQESQPGPSIKRKIKCNYKSKFSKEWTKTWPFIMAVPSLFMSMREF